MLVAFIWTNRQRKTAYTYYVSAVLHSLRSSSYCARRLYLDNQTTQDRDTYVCVGGLAFIVLQLPLVTRRHFVVRLKTVAARQAQPFRDPVLLVAACHAPSI